MFSKKNTLICSGIGTAIFAFLIYYVFGVYGCQDAWFFCRDTGSMMADIFRIFPIILLFCLITYQLRDDVFAAWMRFSKWAVPTIILLIILAPHDQGSWMFPHDKGRVSLWLTTIYALVSIAIIASRHLSQKKSS